MSSNTPVGQIKLTWKQAPHLLLLLTASCLLIGCQGESAQSTTSKVQLTAELQQTYLQTCAQCHTRPTTGAPQAGDVQTWDNILAKGMDKTLERTLNGYGGMPPGGQCFECSPDDLSLLILYMSQPISANQSSLNHSSLNRSPLKKGADS
jgi:cytochrome c5